ncbi:MULTISPECIES: chaperone modulator CbpM [unclassified Rhizobium]|uniref:chaperone modulator CbpM n=1 Tax=unclassified Rhizobium TaxID=2613769 RepID=UPI00160ECE10|nr:MULTISPECIES: chaperone modulator CbpM [unclassified Rhizobium]MBB3545274.1 chaperone modulatory protein CbpM [Rhizobium sp. BK399]MCS3743251.1 chaperone modulatory protein CbpM [Rhizobium sp. BK661]
MDDREFALLLQIDMARLGVFIDRSWISPFTIDGKTMFKDVDVARAELIADLTNEMGINDEGIDVVLDLLDQLHSLRFACNNLIEALETQPLGIRRHVVTDAQELRKLTMLRSRALR